MRSFLVRKKQFWEKQKRLIVQNWLSSFVVTAVVVVAAVVIAPRIPSASFIDTEVFGNDIFFQVEVIDEDAMIDMDSLKIVAKSPLEEHYQPLNLGRQQGSFGTLEPNTEYDLLIYAKYGFGEGVLAKTTLKTEANYGGQIVNWQEVALDPMQTQEMLLMDISTRYNDLKSEIASVNLQFATLYLEEVPIDGSFPTNLTYQTYPIAEFYQTTQIELWAYETVQIYLVLEATLKTNEVVVLDQKTFPSPLQLNASIFHSDIGSDFIKLMVYPDFHTRKDIVYEINLLQDSQVLKREIIIYEDTGIEYEQSEIIIFDRLLSERNYHVQLLAKYFDEITGLEIEKQVNWLDFKTTPAYGYTITSESTDTEINVSVALDDPFAVISNFNFELYYLENEYEMYQTNQYVSIINYTANATFTMEIGKTYIVKIFVTKTADANHIYQYCLLGTITK
ncbi:MAG: hypothetical protein AB7V00_04380 [Bacilli bacterium]